MRNDHNDVVQDDLARQGGRKKAQRIVLCQAERNVHQIVGYGRGGCDECGGRAVPAHELLKRPHAAARPFAYYAPPAVAGVEYDLLGPRRQQGRREGENVQVELVADGHRGQQKERRDGHERYEGSEKADKREKQVSAARVERKEIGNVQPALGHEDSI